jgi:NIPSNAP
MSASAGAGAGLLAADAPKRQQYYELQYFQMKNGPQAQRTNEFFEKFYVPAIRKLGMPPVGFFNPVIGEEAPYLMMIVSHPDFASVETLNDRLHADSEYRKGLEAYLGGDLPYNRREVSLLKAFASMPVLQAPPGNKSHIFEMRTYESNTSLTLDRKIKMFGDGEMGIFKRLGMNPVFFGSARFGKNIPHLTYMLAYDDLAHRDSVWKAFGVDPEWQKLKAQPGLSDAEIVSNISNTILRPTAYSQVK